jgi:hypothetical protein
VQPADGPVQQRPNNRLDGGITGQFIQVALDGGGGLFLVHGDSDRNPATMGRLYSRRLLKHNA